MLFKCCKQDATISEKAAPPVEQAPAPETATDVESEVVEKKEEPEPVKEEKPAEEPKEEEEETAAPEETDDEIAEKEAIAKGYKCCGVY